MLGTDEAVVALLAAVLQVISVSGRGLAVFTFVCDPELHTTFDVEPPMKWQGALPKVKQLVSLEREIQSFGARVTASVVAIANEESVLPGASIVTYCFILRLARYL